MATVIPRLLAGRDDAEAVLTLIRDAFAYMEGRIDPPSSLARLDVNGVLQQSKTGEVWLLGDRPDGVMFLTPKLHALYLGKLAVHRDRRGQGYAGLLVEHAMARAAVLGLGAVELQTRVELVENHAAFEAMGFRKSGESSHTGYDRITTVNYRRDVSNSPQPR